jgi:hypothetical protein
VPIVLSASSPADLEAKGAFVLVGHDGKPAAPGGPAVVPASAAGGGFISIPKTLRLALLGLALSTALIFVRCVRACGVRLRPGAEQRGRTGPSTA